MLTWAPSSRIAVVLLTVILFCHAVCAQGVNRLSVEALEHLANLDFKNLETREDLPHQSVYGIAQDSTGYIWIATYGGLSRFDGYRLRTYRHDRDRPGSLPDNTVRVLVPAASGDLWLGTDTRGVWFYRAATDTFEALPNAPPELLRTRIYTVIPDQQGGIWAGGNFGLFHFDPRTGFQVFPAAQLGTHAGTPAGALPLQRVFALHLDRDGVLWVGGNAGLLRKEPNGGFTPVHGLEGPNEVGVSQPVWSFLRDSAGRLWVGCDHVGLALYDPAAHLLRGVPGLSGAGSPGSSHTVRGILEHRPGQLWIATYGGGLVTYDTGDGHIRSFSRESASTHPLQNSFLRDLLKDRSGVVWLATDNGVATVNDSTTGVFQLQPKLSGGLPGNNEVRSVAMIGGAVWAGFDQGAFGPLDADGTIHAVSPAPGSPPMQREVLAMQQVDAETAFVAGTGGGLFRVDLKSRTYRRVPEPLFDTEVVTGICPDGDRFWAARSDGLFAYNWRTGEGHLYSHDGSPNSLSSNDVRSVLRMRDGRLWISTSDGLNLFDPASGTFRVFRHADRDPKSLPANDIRAMIEDRAGRLWVATTDAGLAVLTSWSTAGEPVFQTLDQRNGLTSATFYTLTLGKDGTVWANTGGGLAAIQPGTFAVRILTAGDGLRVAAQKLFASVTMEDGTLVFRGPEGLILVKPELLSRPSVQLPIVMTGLLLAGDQTSNTPPPPGSVIRLDARHRGLQAEFALLDFASPTNTRYSYRLEGYENGWKAMDPGSRSVVYSNLPPGRFTLHVRASSRAGEGPVSEVSFPVEAPREWSETLVFRLGVILVLCGAIALAMHLRTATIERRSEGLEREVSTRTSELEDNKRQLEAANLLLHDLATRDSMTGLANRRHFLELAEREALRFGRTKRSFSILLLDIDRFKQINDTHGHLAGDAVIRSVAARILSALRTTDLLARFGGEEYIVLLPETASVGAIQVAERIRASIFEDRLVLEGDTLAVTVSIGCAEFSGEETLESLLDRADRALYRAKAAGRNRVELA